MKGRGLKKKISVAPAGTGEGVRARQLRGVHQKPARRPSDRVRATKKLLLGNLGWTANEAREARARLLAFEQDWDAPGMEEYDNL